MRQDFRRDRRHGHDDKARENGWIYGRRPVLEVLRSGRRKVFEAVLPPQKFDTPEIMEMRQLLQAAGVAAKTMEREQLDNLCNGGNHQNCAVRASDYPYVPVEDILEAVDADEAAIVLVLDHIEDPQNVGSLLRSADAVGVTGVIIPEDRASGVTAAAVRASAGASEHLRVARVVNLTRALEQLKEHQVWVTGLDMDTNAKLYTGVDFKGRAGLVVGSEGSGLARLVRETCDFIAYLPMKGGVSSLNAGVAGAVALYEILRQRA